MSFRIRGPSRLQGSVTIQGSKNATQKMLAVALAVPGVHKFSRFPRITDSKCILEAMVGLGCKIDWHNSTTVSIDSRSLTGSHVPAALTRPSSGTFLLAGALLARLGHAEIGKPGGDMIGNRPINYHLEGFRKLGIDAQETPDAAILVARDYSGGVFLFPSPSVNGTVNVALAALGAQQQSRIENIPDEPDIISAVTMLSECGVGVHQDGNSLVVNPGLPRPVEHSWQIPPDRNDAATFLLAVLSTGGEITLHGAPIQALTPLLEFGVHLGARFEAIGSELRVSMPTARDHASIAITTVSGNGFSTDWGPMAQIALAMSQHGGLFFETVFSSRFSHLEELAKMGLAWSWLEERRLTIPGKQQLRATTVRGDNVRGAAALLIAALCAEGVSVLNDCGHLARGYEEVGDRLCALGADISHVEQ